MKRKGLNRLQTKPYWGGWRCEARNQWVLVGVIHTLASGESGKSQFCHFAGFTADRDVPITRLIAGDAVLATALKTGKLLKLLRNWC
jgi:hypothetical protein